MWPYLPLAREDEALRRLIRGVVRRQLKCLLTDPYANAFNDGPTGTGWQDDWTEMKPELHERKWELDSPCYVIRLAYGYWKTTDDASVFDERWTEAMRLVLKTLRDQQRREGPGPYTFQRVTEDALDTQLKNGYGHPAKPVGLIASSFRPSDDATTFPFLIPSNFFAVSSLRKAAEILAHGKPRRNAGRRIRNARRRGRRGAERTRRLRHPRSERSTLSRSTASATAC